MLTVHIYPHWNEAKRAFKTEAEKVLEIMPAGAVTINYSTLTIEKITTTEKHYGGTDHRRLLGLLPKTYVVHDKERCYGKLLDVVRSREILRGTKVVYV